MKIIGLTLQNPCPHGGKRGDRKTPLQNEQVKRGSTWLTNRITYTGVGGGGLMGRKIIKNSTYFVTHFILQIVV